MPGFLAALQASATSGSDDLEDPEEGFGPPDVGSPDAEGHAPEVAAVEPVPAKPELSQIEQQTAAMLALLESQLLRIDIAGIARRDPEALDHWDQVRTDAASVDRVADGVEALAAKHLTPKLAAELAAGLSMAADHRQKQHKESLAGQLDRDPRQLAGHGGNGSAIGSAIDAVVRSPLTLLSAGGAMFKAGMQAAGGAMDRRRKTAFDVLGGQVKSVAADIESDAQWLRAHGLEQVVTEMKASGLAPSEAVGQMHRGGKLERLGLELKGLMAEPDVIERMERLSSNVSKFGVKAERYAKAGPAADRDSNELLGPQLEKLEGALEGLPAVDAEGNFSLMSKKLSDVAEKIRELVERMVNKIMPGR
ncbi:hypothetical protein CSC66_09185 [Pseudoxanthomonas kaohsiungensis]|nr:hypothetical protein CSC66_09185 [Pseudoxanthomonas kaohsiungensis]